MKNRKLDNEVDDVKKRNRTCDQVYREVHVLGEGLLEHALQPLLHVGSALGRRVAGIVTDLPDQADHAAHAELLRSRQMGRPTAVLCSMEKRSLENDSASTADGEIQPNFNDSLLQV